MSGTYDTNKYQFAIHRYLRNPNQLPPYPTPPPSSSSTDYSEKPPHLYQQPSQAMGADSPRYSLLPRLSADDERAPLTGPTRRKGDQHEKQYSIKLSTLIDFLRLFVLTLIIIACVVLLVFFRRPYITAVIFVLINLAQQLLVLCLTKASSVMAFRIRIELKRNDWKSDARNGQMGQQLQRAVHEEGRSVSWGVVLSDALAGLGTMIGAIVIAATTGSAHCVLPFFIMAFQWILAALGILSPDSVFKFVIARPTPSDAEDMLPTVRDSYRDVEHDAGAPQSENAGDGV